MGDNDRSMVLRERGDIFTAEGFATAWKIADALVRSGALPRTIDTPAKAFAVIQRGREMGVPPMRALTGIYPIEGKIAVSPELKLELFRARGGRCKWIRSDNAVAELWLKAPNGDEHTETVTIEDAQRAGLTSKDNWRKYPKSMLRARAEAFGLRALGEGDGSYTPDELGAETDEDGEVTYTPPDRSDHADNEEDRARFQSAMADDKPRKEGLAQPTSGQPANGGSPAAPVPLSGVDRAAKDYLPGNEVPAVHGAAMVSVNQLAEIHILREAIGWPDWEKGKEAWESSLSQWPTYRKALAAYRNAAGERVRHANELQEHQADNLLRRMRAQKRRNDSRLSRMDAETEANVGALPQKDDGP